MGAERCPLDLDFGCPYGCDDSGEHVRTVVAEEGGEAVSMARIKNYRIVIEPSEVEFERSIGRKPRDQEELDSLEAPVEKGLRNGHIDWDLIYECVREVMSGDGDG